MPVKKFQYIYGPVSSWRLGSSLGIDLISQENKVCNFDCVYCQLGKTKIFAKRRKIFVPVKQIIKELKFLPDLVIDYITFSGSGEPTLAENLGAAIRAIKKLRKEKIAVLTNSSLMNRKDVQEDLLTADFVLAKLDAGSAESFSQINRAVKTIKFDSILEAIKVFRGKFKGRLALQIMFTEKNKNYAPDMARLAKDIAPDEVQINTPTRPSAVKRLQKKELEAIKKYFIKRLPGSIKIISVYESCRKKTRPISLYETLKRRGRA